MARVTWEHGTLILGLLIKYTIEAAIANRELPKEHRNSRWRYPELAVWASSSTVWHAGYIACGGKI